MSGVFFRELGLPQPAHHLGVAGGGHGKMTGRMLVEIEHMLLAERPGAVLVYGDTNSTLAGALSAAKLGIPVVHVEAGLRSGRRTQPEEINRTLTDHISSLLFCPTHGAVEQLKKEGITEGVVHVGDVMYDAAIMAAADMRGRDIVDRLGLRVGGYDVATVHRAENTDDMGRLGELVDFLKARTKDRAVVLPLHPRTADRLSRAGTGLDGIITTEPLSFFEMTHLVRSASFVLTDSGGLQKEAYFHRVPCITLRDETEWTETIDAGWNRLWRGPDFRPRQDIDDYGSGTAAGKIAELTAAFMRSAA